MSATRQICTFLLDGQHFGVPVEDVQEVLRFQPTTRVPLSPKCLTGLMNLRGQIVSTIDLRTRLELPCRAANLQPLNVVVRSHEGPKALLVDDIGDVIEVCESNFESATGFLHGSARELIRGAYKLDGRLLAVLDVAKVVRFGQPCESC